MNKQEPYISETRREARRNATIEEIKAAAWEQMARNGPSAISLREISRTMKMSSAAIYRYFSSQADLLGSLSRRCACYCNSTASKKCREFERGCSWTLK